MDNLSHSLVGLAAGELIHRSLPSEPDREQQQLRHRLLLISCWLASNFPDLDLILTPLLPEPLGYLLHHRGHTHTLLYALPQALLIWALMWLWPSARTLLKRSLPARLGLALSLGTGLMLHLLMDYLNPYGIHPFHPFDSHWYFGDMVFILEPTFWVVFGVPVAMLVSRGWLRALFLVALLGLPLFFTLRGFLLWPSLMALASLAAVLALVQHRAGARGKSGLALAALVGLGFVGMQHVASEQGKLVVTRALQAEDPASRVLDISMSSFPTNPLCWIFVSVESNEDAGSYRLRRGQLSLVPNMLPTTACPESLSEVTPEAAPAVAFIAKEDGSLDALRTLKAQNCHFAAWLRFARAPMLGATYATDIRFAGTPQGNFTTLRFEDFKQRECARFVPAWDFPRRDLLSPAQSAPAP
ncbi:MAG TPA: metal-dependent hydrolase [Noviherbaspirillum sp.]|nr:metal-dependent hydrolase [Noviherbaspirillum sp.]